MSLPASRDKDLPPYETTTSSLRVFIVGAVALIGIAVFFHEARPIALLGLAAMALVTALQRPRQLPSRSRKASARTFSLWPETAMKAVVEAIAEPCIILDRNLMLRYANQQVGAAFGVVSLGDSIALRFRSPELLASIERAVKSAGSGRAQYVERGPAARAWEVEISPVPAARGEDPFFFLMLFHDRTVEHEVERMRSDFVANASHELRTPLASVIGFIETLQGPARDDPVAREKFLGVMHDQARRMSRLIDDLMSLSRIEMKRHIPIETRVDLNTLLRETCEMMAPLAAESGVALEFEPPQGEFLVLGERDQLIQVFSNLIENACKYGDSGERVVLSLSAGRNRDLSYYDVSVRDFGAGIPAEHVPRLTERFYRVDAGRSKARRGTGLGLSIVRNILVRHRAELLIESELGKGSVFTARLPALKDGRSF
ncbi:ATP-binding protein [Consotaella salsifontis]|uniref:histidine kinase n=1 Tax=Consotaella salsifontis TaxID=1365950 RepID=A0A1T4MLA4_9HYPH|nr:ATP-binding protein [Consotaella salsifontis]SJZ67595.1 two-component system, OmpR family, phosphate regulon sensor histidine kinase PhoR [Consotaella salsifontis]